MKLNKTFLVAIILGVFSVLIPGATVSANQGDVRETVQRVFQQLKARDYNALYDSLPSTSRARTSRDRFASSLRRAQDMYVLDRLDVGQIRVAKDIAIVDTVLYGRVTSPIAAEGKIVVQQYLVREDGKWRVATGDTGIIKSFLAGNPEFRKFTIRPPQVYVKQGNAWVEFSPQRKR